jgi:hypothetical protein
MYNVLVILIFSDVPVFPVLYPGSGTRVLIYII